MILEISKKVFENILWEFLRKPQALSKTGASYARHILKSKNMFREAMYFKRKQKLSKHHHNKTGGVKDENSLQRHSRSRLFCDDSFQPRLYSPLSDNPCVNTQGTHPPTGIWPLRPPPTVIRKLVAHNRRGKGSARGRKGSLCLQQPANTGQCVSIQRRILFLAFTQLSMHVWHILSKMGTRQFFHLLAI